MNYLLHSHLKPGIAYQRKANVTKGQHGGEKRQAVSGMCYLNHADHLDKRRALNMTAEQTNKAFFSGCQSALRRLRSGLRCFGLAPARLASTLRSGKILRATRAPCASHWKTAPKSQGTSSRTAPRPAPQLLIQPAFRFKYCVAFVTIYSV